jgi:hypothetical protein
MAEHVARTTVVVMRVLATAIGGAPGNMRIQSKPRCVMIMLRLAYRRLPAKTGREQGRQEDGEQCRSDIFGSATHGRILPDRIQWPDLNASIGIPFK